MIARRALAFALTLVAFACDRDVAPTSTDTAIARELDRAYEALASDLDRKTGARQISTTELLAALTDGRPVVLVDVRETSEQAISTLRGAHCTTPREVGAMELDAPEEALVVTYCTAGYRSGLAAIELEKRLDRRVYSLHGGIIAWYNAGGEVVNPAGSPIDRVHPYSEDWGQYLRQR